MIYHAWFSISVQVCLNYNFFYLFTKKNVLIFIIYFEKNVLVFLAKLDCFTLLYIFFILYF